MANTPFIPNEFLAPPPDPQKQAEDEAAAIEALVPSLVEEQQQAQPTPNAAVAALAPVRQEGTQALAQANAALLALDQMPRHQKFLFQVFNPEQLEARRARALQARQGALQLLTGVSFKEAEIAVQAEAARTAQTFRTSERESSQEFQAGETEKGRDFRTQETATAFENAKKVEEFRFTNQKELIGIEDEAALARMAKANEFDLEKLREQAKIEMLNQIAILDPSLLPRSGTGEIEELRALMGEAATSAKGRENEKPTDNQLRDFRDTVGSFAQNAEGELGAANLSEQLQEMGPKAAERRIAQLIRQSLLSMRLADDWPPSLRKRLMDEFERTIGNQVRDFRNSLALRETGDRRFRKDQTDKERTGFKLRQDN